MAAGVGGAAPSGSAAVDNGEVTHLTLLIAGAALAYSLEDASARDAKKAS